MSCNYCWNQPIKHGKYDFYLDGKLTANEVVYKTLSESGKKENVDLDTKIKEIEKRLDVHFTFQTVTELPEVGEETVIYLKSNDETSADPDAIDTYNEYMWVKDKGAYELIGSGTYEKQKADLKAEIDARIQDVLDEENRAMEKEAQIDAELAKRVPYTLHKSVNVVGNVKDVVKLDVPESSNEAMYCPQGLIMGGTAKDAGLVTRGICGVSAPNNDGSCEKENLYINYDGTDTYSSSRQLIIQAGTSGQSYGHNLYQFAAARGDAVKGYVDAQVKVEKERATGVENNLLNKFNNYTTTDSLEATYATKDELNGVDEKFANYVTIESLQSQIKVLNETIAGLESRIAALEPAPEPEPEEQETPTE